MPRSNFYRSFVTCHDPSGVVQCTTIKRSKTGSQRKENNVETQTPITKNKSSKELIDELGRSSSVQLKEVSEKVEKLNKVVDSLPKRSFNTQSEDIAKDVLRGALNLQESLRMFGKLQEETPKWSNSKKIHKETKHDIQRSYSDRFGDHKKNVTEFQKPRLSADGSSRDCYDELREVISDNFSRQNLVTQSARFDTKFDLSTASSSQSSMFTSNDFASSNSSLSTQQAEKPKRSNLIAKLMGLEEFPSNNKRVLNNNTNTPIFDIDLLNARKPSITIQKEKPEHTTLGEILEIMEFKQVVKNKSFDRSNQKTQNYNVSKFSDDTAPIVVIKTREKELSYMNKCPCGKKASDSEEMLWGIKKDFPPKKIDRKIRADKSQVKRSNREKESEDDLSSIQSKGEAIDKRVDKIKKVAPIMKRNARKDENNTELDSKTSIISKRNNQGKINSTKVSNLGGSVILKNQAAVTTKSYPGSSTRKKKSSTIIVENTGHESVNTEVNLTSSEPLLFEEESHASNHYTLDDKLITQQNRDVRDILLRSESFINYAEELFDTTSVQVGNTRLERGPAVTKLILDCANEILASKCLQWGLTVHPLLQHPSMRTKISISFDYLVAKICHEIDHLRSYSKFSGEILVIDTLYDLLKRDLLFKGVVTGAWDQGWLNGFTFDEVEQVVMEIEQALISEITEDLLLDCSLK